MKRDLFSLRKGKISPRKRLSRSCKHRWWHAARLAEPSCPIACGTPAPIAASSLAMPAAIAAQNRLCSSRPATGGRPGDDKGARPDRSERRFRLVIATAFPSRCCDDHLNPPPHRQRREECRWCRRCAMCGGCITPATTDSRVGVLARKCRRWANACTRPTIQRCMTARSGKSSGQATRCMSPRHATPMRHIWLHML